MAVKNHLVGAGGFGDRLDPHASNAVAMKKILGAGDDPLPGTLRRDVAFVRFCIFLRHGS